MAAASQHPCIGDDVHHHDESADGVLRIARESLRIEDREDVVCDEVARVVVQSGAAPQHVLERRERTDPAGELDERRPCRARDMRPGDAWPPHREHAAHCREDDERKMDDDNERGEKRHAYAVDDTVFSGTDGAGGMITQAIR